ncbi:5-deoxy-glucuronate isomerase [Rudaeicoccus suwonensis]|uniref:5-deoxyglucuronate isomerase n=1 Tax=Rudaeicoccus suwonensis TaxID=657409 RepID=A0A561EBD5_9MICO|nr:5-deoxy-glucuronate isomerase [Rudaeicoccus suwonensis]TWE12919.1 5-deoxyglucuronate isomerase [Rudaeicoccus suwonensis]
MTYDATPRRDGGAGPDRWFRPAALTTATGLRVAVQPDGEPLRHTGLTVLALRDGEAYELSSGPDEYLLLPLSGGGDVDLRSGTLHEILRGREDVFSAAADCAYVPRDHQVTVTARGPVEVALCAARATGDLPPAVLRAPDTPVELRGAGCSSRQVRNFGTPDAIDATAIIACEVLTPGGNSSSYPPHRHDCTVPGIESELEEIYYFRLRADPAAPDNADPIGFCRVGGSGGDEASWCVRDGDVLLVPAGWHGPATAVPGYDLYYLNVMAGPGPERRWLISDDPAHDWVRDTWADQPIDPRLPF